MINGGSQEGKKETYINFTCMYKFVNSPQFFLLFFLFYVYYYLKYTEFFCLICLGVGS